jgi:predicted MFS family arabinose efflux permease
MQDAAHPATPHGGRYPAYVLAVLLAVYAMHHIDRQVVTLLLEPIKHDFALSDSQLGFLAGLCYAVAFALGGLPLGLLIDRVHRVRLLAVLISAWSGLTALCGLANGFLWLVLARIGVATAESGATPANLSILADYFGPRRRSAAVGIYMMGPHLGTIVGFAAAALVAQAWGWRAAFFLAGVPGLLLMLLLLASVREPARGAADASPARGETLPVGTALRQVLAQAAFCHTMAGVVLAMCVAAGLAAWQAPFLIRSYGVNLKEVGLSLAFAVATCGAAGAWFGGWLSGRLGQADPARMPLLTAAAAALTIPAALFALFAASFPLAVAGFAVQNFFVAMTAASGYGLCLSLSGARTRGTAMALLQVLSNVVGYGLGPQLVGLFSDHLPAAARGGSLPYAMALLNVLSLWALVHLLIAARRIRGGQGQGGVVPVMAE